MKRNVSVVRFKCRCNILISGKIIKEMPGSVASGTHCTNQLHTRFYISAVKRDRYLHILHFLHSTDNNKEPGSTDENSDRLWTKRNLCEILKKTFSKFYSPSEYLAVD